jgi:hypothetical protein
MPGSEPVTGSLPVPQVLPLKDQHYIEVKKEEKTNDKFGKISNSCGINDRGF